MPRKAVKGERRLASLNMKTTEALRRHLEHEAEKSGRTLTHEVEYRLERSFSEDGTYTTATNAAILRDLAGIFTLIGFDRKIGANRSSRKLLMSIMQRIVDAHLPDPPSNSLFSEGLGGVSHGDAVKIDDAALNRLQDYCLKLADVVIESSALPALPVFVPKAAPPFGFHSEMASPGGILGLLGGQPASLDKLQKKADAKDGES